MKLIVTPNQASQGVDLRELYGISHYRRLAAFTVASDRTIQLLALPIPICLTMTGILLYITGAIAVVTTWMIWSYFNKSQRMTKLLLKEVWKQIPPGSKVLAFRVEAGRHLVVYDYAFITKARELQSLEAKVDKRYIICEVQKDSVTLDRQLTKTFASWPDVRAAAES